MIIAFICLSWPVWRPQMFMIHDFTHGVRIAEMTQALKDGHFPVRWSKNLGYGYGMPLFEFYGPLPFYVGSIIYWLSGRLIFSVKSLFLISNLMTLIGAWLLGKKLFQSRFAPVAVSLAIGLAPYRMLNLYIRGALNELWGIMALPWILWAVIKLIRGEKYGFVLTALSLSVLFTSHNITTLIFAPFFLIFSFGMIAIQKSWINKNYVSFVFKTLLRIGLASLLAIGMSAFYLLPAFFEKGFTQVEKYILADYFNFRIHFLYLRQLLIPKWGYGGSEWGPDDPISFFLGFGQVVTLVIAGIIGVWNLLHNIKTKKSKINIIHWRILCITGFLLFGSCYFTLLKSQWAWEKISILSYVQFPWRFLSLGLIFLGVLSGWVVNQLTILLKNNHAISKLLSGLLIGLFLINGIFVIPEGYLEKADSVYTADKEVISSQMSSILPDYLPQNMNIEVPATSLVLNQDQFNSGELNIVVNRTHELLVRTLLNQPKKITLNIADYPGWQAYLNNMRIDHSHDLAGRIVIDVPIEEQHLSLRFEPTPLRLASDAISFASIWIFLLLLWFQRSHV